MVIESKSQYYALARRGLLGNTIRQWTATQFMAKCIFSRQTLPKVVAVRGLTPASKHLQAYDLTLDRAYAICKAHSDLVLVDEQAPDDHSVIKGEVMRDGSFWYLRYDMTPGLRMREAFPIMKHAYGLEAYNLLRRHMDASSWDCLQDIFDRYPDSIVEFTCYDRRVGQFGWNTLFWEVRNY